MSSTGLIASPADAVSNSAASMRDYWVLLKPGVMSLVVFTGAVGLWLAPVGIHPFLGAMAVFAIALGSGAGAAINMWFDRDIDGHMKRTATRPIPAGRVAADDALAMGLMLAVLSVTLLGMVANWQAAALLGFAIFFYAVIYTMLLKRHTAQNIVIGGAAGAFPPVIGWMAASPEPALLPWLLFLIIFFWTPPHFWALALYRSADYARVRIPMLPVTAGIVSTKRHILAYSVVLVVASLLPSMAGLGLLYTITASLLGARFLLGAWRVWRSDASKTAMALFGYSIFYLFALFAAMIGDMFTRGMMASM